MPHADHLLANGAGAPHRSPRQKILPQRMQARDPIYTAMPVKPLILRNYKSLPQQRRKFMQGQNVVTVPAVVIGNHQRNMTAVRHRHLAQPVSRPGKGNRNRQEIMIGFPEQRPGGGRCKQEHSQKPFMSRP